MGGEVWERDPARNHGLWIVISREISPQISREIKVINYSQIYSTLQWDQHTKICRRQFGSPRGPIINSILSRPLAAVLDGTHLRGFRCDTTPE